MKTLTLKLSDDLSTRLVLMARQGGTNKSDIVRKALEEYLSRKQPDTTNSFFEMAGDIAGCVNGSDDLSVNKDYLEGNGK